MKRRKFLKKELIEFMEERKKFLRNDFRNDIVTFLSFEIEFQKNI